MTHHQLRLEPKVSPLTINAIRSRTDACRVLNLTLRVVGFYSWCNAVNGLCVKAQTASSSYKSASTSEQISSEQLAPNPQRVFSFTLSSQVERNVCEAHFCRLALPVRRSGIYGSSSQVGTELHEGLCRSTWGHVQFYFGSS